MAKPKFDDFKFAVAWEQATSLADVAKAMGCTPAAASSKASALRKAGVHLKQLPRASRGIDVAHLNELIAEVNKTMQREPRVPTPPPPRRALTDAEVLNMLKKLSRCRDA